MNGTYSHYGTIFSFQSLYQLIRVFPLESLIMLLACLNIFVPNIISYTFLLLSPSNKFGWAAKNIEQKKTKKNISYLEVIKNQFTIRPIFKNVMKVHFFWALINSLQHLLISGFKLRLLLEFFVQYYNGVFIERSYLLSKQFFVFNRCGRHNVHYDVNIL